MIYRIHPDAAEEFEKAYEYYEKDSLRLATEFTAEILIGLHGILESPSTWPIIEANVRRRIIKRFPYGILYEVIDEEILVLAFMHLKKEPGYWLPRREA